MKNKDYKIFRDPIYTFVSFDKEEEQVVIDIINTPIFQRLRRIKQLGFSEFTYPSATHTRFSHSLGVAYLVGEIFDKLQIPNNINLKVILNGDEKEVILDKKQLKLILRLAGLLHDIGHGPFSHAFEKLVGDSYSHEKMTVKIIENSEISEIIKNCPLFKHDINEVVVRIISDLIKGELSLETYWLKELISSQLDADRMDYLLRDSYMCGVPYAFFDLKWLINHLEIKNIPHEGDRLGIVVNAKKGIYTVEAFIISRYHMYEQVYFHKTTRAFECVLEKLFERIKELIDRGEENSLFEDEVLISFIKNSNNIEQFLKLDDTYLWYYFRKWTEAEDRILSKLSQTIIQRFPPKMLRDITSDSQQGKEFRNWYYDIRKQIENKFGCEILNYFFFEDDYKNVPYKDSYLLGETSPEKAERIWVILEDNTICDIANVSSLLKTLKNAILKRTRFYIDREYWQSL